VKELMLEPCPWRQRRRHPVVPMGPGIVRATIPMNRRPLIHVQWGYSY